MSKHSLQSIISTLFISFLTLNTLSSCSCGRDGDEDSETAENFTPVFPEPVTGNFGVSTETMEIADNNLVHRTNVNPIGGSLREVFCDSNAVHLAAAHQIGFSPITNLKSAYAIARAIQRIYTCKAYHVDDLTHSMPYLVPKAAKLLYDIGTEFSDTVFARSGASYRIKVTSLTRTDMTVARLRRHNRNATVESAHRYGTTFDISYARFMCLDESNIISLEDLKNILAEILNKKRNDNLCYVKFERKQGCFHITAR